MLPCCFSDHLAYANGLCEYENALIPGWFENLRQSLVCTGGVSLVHTVSCVHRGRISCVHRGSVSCVHRGSVSCVLTIRV